MDAKEIIPNVFLLEFEDQVSLMRMFCRFQEHYESPEFRNKIFTLEEFKQWYSKNYGVDGKFTYYTDWNGCNIPSYVLLPFMEGEFDPLSEEEQEFVELFRDKKHPFYVIGVHKDHDALLHETAHALYYTNEEYKKQVDDVLKDYDTTKIQEALTAKMYCDEVLMDEVHAYSLSGSSKLKVHIPEELSSRLYEIFTAFKE